MLLLICCRCSLIQKSASGARAAYQYASVSAKGLVEDADKLDIVVKACQTEYIKLKLVSRWMTRLSSLRACVTIVYGVPMSLLMGIRFDSCETLHV